MDVGLVCDACSALTPIGVPQCARCGEPVALDPRRATKPTAQSATKSNAAVANAAAATRAPATTSCPNCGTKVSPGLRFCPSCGHKQSGPPPNFDVETKVGPRTDATTRPTESKAGRNTLFF